MSSGMGSDSILSNTKYLRQQLANSSSSQKCAHQQRSNRPLPGKNVFREGINPGPGRASTPVTSGVSRGHGGGHRCRRWTSNDVDDVQPTHGTRG